MRRLSQFGDPPLLVISLNNKLLVFFFMATLAIAVVVFLCGAMIGRGVMVGRGVRNATLAVPGKLCLLFIHPRAPNLISLRSAGNHAGMIWSFVRARLLARPQTQTLSC